MTHGITSPNTYHVMNTFTTEPKQQVVVAIRIVAIVGSSPQCEGRVDDFYLALDF